MPTCKLTEHIYQQLYQRKREKRKGINKSIRNTGNTESALVLIRNTHDPLRDCVVAQCHFDVAASSHANKMTSCPRMQQCYQESQSRVALRERRWKTLFPPYASSASVFKMGQKSRFQLLYFLSSFEVDIHNSSECVSVDKLADDALNSLLSHFVLPVLFLPYWSFRLYVP